MAKNAGRLAGLAALAGAAYMMSKNKDKESGTTDSNPTRAARPESTETRLKTPAQSIAEADKSVGSGPSPNTQQPSGTLTQGTDTSAVDLNPDRNKPVVKPVVSPVPQPVSDADNKSAAAIPSGIFASTRSNTQIPVLPLGSSDKKTYERKAGATAKEIKDYRDQQDAQKRIDALRSSGGRRAAGGAIKKMASGGMTSKPSSASKRADGIASRGKTRCKMY